MPQNHCHEIKQHHKFISPFEMPPAAKRRMPKTAHGPISIHINTQPAQKQMTLAASFSKAVPYEKKSQKWKEITATVTHYIAKDMAPISVVEKPGFKNLVKTLDPKYELPGRKFFAEKALPELYISEREKLAHTLTDVTFYASTTDLWSSRTCDPYLSFTVHYIANWELKSACLQTSFFPEDHTGEILAHGLEEVLAAWNLQQARQVSITTDNGANIVKACNLIGYKLKKIKK